MYRTEKQARAAAYILTRNVRIQYSPQFDRGLESEPKDTSTHKCVLENQLSLRSDNGEIEVATAARRCVEFS